jgi:DinB family protein
MAHELATEARMNYDLQHSDLSTVLAEGRLVADETRRAFGQLSAEQVNWKPSEAEWSIGQCFDHLIISNRPYLTIVEEIRAGKRRQRAWEHVPLLPRFFGKLLITTLRPDSGRKVKARPAFYPSTSQIATGIITSFVEQQDRLLHLMEATRGLHLDAITITSPVVRLITYSLMDAYRIIVVHEQNHFVQARRLMELPGFPGYASFEGASRAQGPIRR